MITSAKLIQPTTIQVTWALSSMSECNMSNIRYVLEWSQETKEKTFINKTTISPTKDNSILLVDLRPDNSYKIQVSQ